MFMFFADLNAAFDRLDRTELNRMMAKKGVDEHLRKRIMEVYKETKNCVRIGEDKTDIFWTEKRVRQGCPLSPTLFNLYLADLEEEMGKEKEEDNRKREVVGINVCTYGRHSTHSDRGKGTDCKI